jgi:Ca-activated chloride channel homolog
MIRLASPLVLPLLLPAILLVLAVNKLGPRINSSIRFSSKRLVDGIKPSFRVRLSGKLIYLRAIGLSLIIIAMARPQSTLEQTHIYVEGVDIVLAVDTSTSMRAMDFQIAGNRVDRLEAVKHVVADFIKKRSNDRIGLVAFSALAYTICPLTLDHEWLEKNLERVEIGMIEDGTAIGSGITASLNRIKDTPTKEKIVILLTDGRNNAGRVSPLVAAEAARAMGVRVYTIGAGTEGLAPYPFKDMFGNTVLQPVDIQIDEKLLEEIADMSGGMYFRATDTSSLERIYDEIDKLEKTPIEETGYNIYRELFGYFLIPGMVLLALEILLANSRLRRIP